MRPTIPLGSEVALEHIAPGLLQPGDVVAFAAGTPSDDKLHRRQHLVLHRLVERLPDGRLATQGDGCAQADVPWTESAFVGRVIAWRAGPAAAWRVPRRWIHLLLHRSMRLSLPRLGLRFRRLVGLLAWRSGDEGPAGAPFEVASASGVPHKTFEVNDVRDWQGAPVDVQKLGDQWVVYEKSTGAMHVLNSVAGLIWQYRSEGLDDEAVVLKLQQHFPDVSLATLTKDVARTSTQSLPDLPKEMASPEATGSRAR